MALRFVWDLDKAIANERWHGVSFPEATTVFDDLLSIAVPDLDHSIEEQRLGASWLWHTPSAVTRSA
jgi:uncharacterized DUF497 family protein